jgi:hypothetical protein
VVVMIIMVMILCHSTAVVTLDDINAATAVLA